jgi:outer membrane protein assembly factor BamB
LTPIAIGYTIVNINGDLSLTGMGPKDSPWPMYCHDTRHTGRSPYSTVDTWDEIWKFETYGWAEGGPVIDEEGIIYIGAYSLYAVYPNGTLKWEYGAIFTIASAPAIDKNGVIYFGTIYGNPYLFAVYTNNGTLKWKYFVGDNIFSSPAIGDGGTIYFGSGGDYPPTGRINALYPNGTLKWEYETTHVVYSSPAIGEDGTIYCGSHDTYLYALYPNNGTLKWRYKTGGWIRTSPCIGDDGTIYVVSLDGDLHAVNPDGTLKWKTCVGAGTSPTIGQDGTIYAGSGTLHAINSTDGSVKWTFDVGGSMAGGTPCNSIDGIIYVGTGDNGQIVAINSDGTERCEDGTVYIGSSQAPGEGFLHAFGRGQLEADANGPYYGLINEPLQFEGFAGGGYSPHSFHWDFGDTHSSDEQNPTHIYTNPGNYTVTLTVIDNESNTTSDTTYAWVREGNTPPDAPSIDGPNSGYVGERHCWTIQSADPNGDSVYYYIDWDDGAYIGWVGPYPSLTSVEVCHIYKTQGNYTIKAKATDMDGLESDWGTLSVMMPRNRVVNNPMFIEFMDGFMDRFPLFARLLRLL